MIAANGDNHRIPGNRRSRDLTADGLRHNDFSGVDNVIARHGINDHPRQERFDIHRMGGTAAVARAVGGAGANRIDRLAQAPTAEAGTVTLQLPELSAVALYARPFNITVTVVPVARPLEPPLMVRS